MYLKFNQESKFISKQKINFSFDILIHKSGKHFNDVFFVLVLEESNFARECDISCSHSFNKTNVFPQKSIFDVSGFLLWLKSIIDCSELAKRYVILEKLSSLIWSLNE